MITDWTLSKCRTGLKTHSHLCWIITTDRHVEILSRTRWEDASKCSVILLVHCGGDARSSKLLRAGSSRVILELRYQHQPAVMSPHFKHSTCAQTLPLHTSRTNTSKIHMEHFKNFPVRIHYWKSVFKVHPPRGTVSFNWGVEHLLLSNSEEREDKMFTYDGKYHRGKTGNLRRSSVWLELRREMFSVTPASTIKVGFTVYGDRDTTLETAMTLISLCFLRWW